MSQGMITFEQKGDFKKTYSFLEKCLEVVNLGWLDKYGRKGVEALRSATPKDSGLAADSWGYEIERDGKNVTLVWTNSDIEGGFNVAILVEYGHGTRGGTYVEGKHFISPAIQPIFDEIANNIWEEMNR